MTVLDMIQFLYRTDMSLPMPELDPAEKNRISHRGRALQAAIEQWGSLLRPTLIRKS